MKQEVLNAVAREFAQLDVSAEEAEIAQIEQQIADTHKAIETAENRRTKIAREIHEYKFNGPNSKTVADALLAGIKEAGATTLSPSPDALESEREALRVGIRELLYRVEDLRAELSLAEGRALQKLAPGGQMLIAEAMTGAKAAIDQFLGYYAAVVAIHAGTKQGGRDLDMLSPVVRLVADKRDLADKRTVDVPAGIMEALSPLQGKGRALRAGFPTEIQI